MQPHYKKLAFIVVSIPVVPKLSSNHVRIGSRKERLVVQRKKLSS